MASTTRTSDLRDFIEFARNQLVHDGNDATPEDVLDRWRAEHPDPNDVSQTVAALRVALAEADRGEGQSLDDFDRAFREKHRIPVDA